MAKPIITIHSVRRFAERVLGVTGLPEHDEAALVALRMVHGVDVAKVEIMLARLVERGVSLGASAVLFGGARFVLKGPHLITILNIKRQPRFGLTVERALD